ncbi:NAD(P)-dependent oxidoreductase [Paenibacillus cymbidii]|uniref:NAD(P)-dependent oxidoreductase n=1 Tax=Paenibacillus cymbidii TaxID=1639034 RepID=UPI001081DCC5|nr:NAD(P)-dependent oxidoreductase [Paenibacillus cymbidii]
MKLLNTARMEAADLERLRGLFPSVVHGGWGFDKKKLTETQMAEAIAGSDAALIEFEPVTARVLDAAGGRLRFIACCRNEPEASVDIAAATKRGIPVLTGAGRNAVSVAEFNFGLLLSLARHIGRTDYLLKHTDAITGIAYSRNDQLKGPSEWSLDEQAPFNRFGGPELHGKKLGIVGFGTIGRVVARMGRAFGMEPLVFDPYVTAETIAAAVEGTKSSLEELMSEADFVSLHAKVTPETTGLIGSGALSLMKRSAYLVNTARAAIMDYDALYRALAERRIAGAALDVYPEEPIGADNPFLRLDNVVLTPHLAGASHDIPKHHSRLVADDILRLMQGERPHRIANPEVLEAWRP